MPNQRALISVSDKTGLTSFAQKLHDAGIELIASGGTATQLADAGLPVTPTEALTGFPELLDGRVKTLHPAIHGGILARRTEEHLAELEQQGLLPIDLVIVNLYPFEQTVAGEGVSRAEAVEQIDIGGTALLRAAAKNFESVTVICDPSDYERVATAVSDGGLDAETRLALALKAFRHTAAYDTAISDFLARQHPQEQTQEAGVSKMPAQIQLNLERVQVMRYGENPHQQGAFYRHSNGSPAFEQLHGQEMSYNNWLDLDGSWQAAQDFDAPTVAIIKHSNPCGLASADTLSCAYDNALASDPVSAFGSIISVNRTLDRATAERMSKLFVEIVAAPAFDEEALALLQRKKNLRILRACDTAPHTLNIRTVYGGALVQEPDASQQDLEPANWRIVTQNRPDASQLADLAFAWRVCRHVKSNAIVYAAKRATVGVGAGQMSRVDSVMLAGHKAGERARGAVMASDAFFPFADGIEAAAAHGVAAVVQPGGSIRDGEVIECCDRLGMVMAFTGTRHFRH
ncbi:MAG: bifunctional phosphoribosylaminoimidazolecarboxamide formyltransferase/IMP cyclohydrolase [Caldilineaceae bacterium SB0661_bin_32]|uniref:Bifunctional purine biosynthesis protein PurH n=1 Tax=Caldilineaceae bacterium SB0661_bin_32 TaxID=2605255 RepID=A0A6B1D814_9CHLR|nr:bifunctional phosphoribosylaminoimidazolecarboxamide formyltransferase/IMP cyclohydrolase [Caldilineaceae bacterium SB0661_bin_32]